MLNNFAVNKLYLIIFICIAFALLAGGCGSIRSQKSISKKIEELLADKYGKEFSVQSVELVRDGEAASPEYYAVASLAGGTETFDVYADIKLTGVSDCYAKLLFDNQICGKVESLLLEAEGLNGYSYYVYYPFYGQIWSEENTFEEYFSESDAYVRIKLAAINTEAEAAAKYVYNLAEALKENGISFRISYDFNDNKTYLFDNAADELESFDKFLQKFMSEETNA